MGMTDVNGHEARFKWKERPCSIEIDELDRKEPIRGNWVFHNGREFITRVMKNRD